jgi:hypothetical protein
MNRVDELAIPKAIILRHIKGVVSYNTLQASENFILFSFLKEYKLPTMSKKQLQDHSKYS